MSIPGAICRSPVSSSGLVCSPILTSLLKEERMARTLGCCVVWGLVFNLSVGRAAAQDKVHSVGKDGLKIEGKVEADDA